MTSVGVHLVWLCVLLCISCGQPSRSQDTMPQPSLRIVHLPDVHGRIDHLALDPQTQKVFIAALGNNSVEVVDLEQGRHVASITGIAEPQGIALIPSDHSVLVASGGDGSCVFYDVGDHTVKRTIKLDGDADNVRYAPALEQIFIGHGAGGIAVIDARTFAVITDIALGGHPESLQVDARHGRLFVNVPDKREVVVIDLPTMQVLDRWEMKDATANFPMVLDTADQQVVIGCRSSSKLLVYNYEGHLQQSLDGPGDMDDLFYDGARRTLYAIGGAGTVALFERTDRNTFVPGTLLRTSAGARTGLLIPEEHMLLIAAPARGKEPAALLVQEWR